ncbi:hypothetical protein Tco_1559020, partial [Tanacetum coccineum]
MPWTGMKQLMTAEFCPIEEIQRLEHEMVEPERVKIDAYIRGLTDNIKGEVTSSKPADLNEAVCMAHKLMEQKSQARNERILESKKQKWESLQGGNSSGKGNQKDNSRQTLQNNQKQGNTRAMVTPPIDGKLPLCKRCFTRHVSQCTIKCHKCGKDIRQGIVGRRVLLRVLTLNLFGLVMIVVSKVILGIDVRRRIDVIIGMDWLVLPKFDTATLEGPALTSSS